MTKQQRSESLVLPCLLTKALLQLQCLEPCNDLYPRAFKTETQLIMSLEVLKLAVFLTLKPWTDAKQDTRWETPFGHALRELASTFVHSPQVSTQVQLAVTYKYL